MKARLGFFYFAIFTFIGIHMPFWPVWLKSRGIDAVGIAALSALSFGLKIVVTPWVSRRVDASGRKREAMRWLAFALLASCCLFTFTHGFAQIFVITTLAFTVWSPIMSLGESITTVLAKAQRLDYGRIRLWGSVSFMLVAIASGRMLEVFGEQVLLWAIGTAALMLWVACLAMPADARTAAARPAASNTPFLRSRWFVGFILATMLIQGSHGAYYTFASIHWRDIGLSDQTVGLLWGTSLVSEVLFFTFGRPLVDKLGPMNVLLLGGVAAALRWAAICLTGNPLLLALAQLLHAASFGASHFAAIRLISERVDDSLSASGQGLYSAYVMGLGMGVFVLASGPLYQSLGAGAFLAMSLVALAGVAVLSLTRCQALARIEPQAARPAVAQSGAAAA